MPPFAILPLTAAAVLGAVIVARWAMREFRRVNGELDALKTAKAKAPAGRPHAPTLRRDPKTGVYRPD